MNDFDLGWLMGMSKNPVALGLLIFGLVQTVKRQAEARKPPVVWNPWVWRGIAAMFGLICAGLLHVWTGNAMLGTTGWLGVLVFGLVASVVAVAGRDGLKTVLEWVGQSGQVTQTTTQATTPDGATVATTTTTAPVGAVQPDGEPVSLRDGPPPEAFTQAGAPKPLADLSFLPNDAPVTNPVFTMRE